MIHIVSGLEGIFAFNTNDLKGIESVRYSVEFNYEKMCWYLYVHQLRFLVSTGCLDIIAALIRIYCYVAKADISGWMESSSVFGDKDNLIYTGFILDCISCIIPASAMIVMFLLMLGNCCQNYGTSRLQTGEFYAKIGAAPIRRMLTMRCNCPCYRTRPKFRFINRVILLILCVLFRIISSILYSVGGRTLLVIVCSISIVFLLISLAYDYYHYRMWWHYRPEKDTRHTKYSSKHRRFLPYHILGDNRDPMTLGNEPCTHEPCDNRKLEHILIYHYSDHRPQQRWFDISNQTQFYVGFHRRGAEKAIKIAHSEMPLSRKEPQMLGFGIYFARSIEDTKGKARQDGAIICATIRMGKVLLVERSDVSRVQDTDSWHQEYDTVYCKHPNPALDEFCIKSADQILEWVIVIDESCDRKVKKYGLDTEFSDTRCLCI
ncbi:unnamed protein product [Adineta ricciae]|uniref:PARP catalytic domain-containing protein n=1 Tax=Adineta ricciae TaxID=249248 RepID=A0A815YTD5_ADIRI|nr:unnamed protein product [Adineta ricciae]CAF1575975.1 unnamed protein product [Adineta ricciae]